MTKLSFSNLAVPLTALLLTLSARAADPPEMSAHVGLPPSNVDAKSPAGAQIFRDHCSGCHEGQAPRAPTEFFLHLMAPDTIVSALTSGIMRAQGSALGAEQRQQVAEYLSGQSLASSLAAPPAPLCAGEAARFAPYRPSAEDLGNPDLANTQFVRSERAGLSSSDLPRLKLKWAFAFPGATRARSRLAAAMGALYVGSQDGTVYALDAKTGCVRWRYRATAEVRGITVSEWKKEPRSAEAALVFFGDIIGNVYAAEAKSGRLRWKIHVDDHPSATITAPPAYYAGRIYVAVSSLEEAVTDPAYECCTFRGSVVALDADSGKQIWRAYTIPAPKVVAMGDRGKRAFAPSGVAIWNTPALDLEHGVLYVGTGNNYSAPATPQSDSVMAFSLTSGKRLWWWQSLAGDAWNTGCIAKSSLCPEHAGPDHDIGGGVTLVNAPHLGDLVVAGSKSGLVFALKPERPSRPVWERKVGAGSISGGIEWGLASDGTHIFAPISDQADTHDSKAYTEARRPGLYALDAATGVPVWSTHADDVCAGRPFCESGISAPLAVIPGAVFAGHLDGRLRAYSSTDGHVLWQFDTSAEVLTVSGATVHGGTIAASGPLVSDGMVYVNSGHGIFFRMPGNVLLAFSVDGT